MAKVYLKSGRDPALRRLAEHIITSQEAEIEAMRRSGGEAAASGSGSGPHAGH